MSDDVRRRFGRMTVTVAKGDITRQTTDAIVNAANNRFWMGSGVAGAIKRAGGDSIETEAVALGPAEPGGAVSTSAGRLPCRHVIHAAAMGQDLVTSAELLGRATASALDEAVRLGLSTVAFPALGTGVGGFPVRTAARTMLRTLLDHCAARAQLEEVRFVLLTPEVFAAFGDELAALPGEPG